MLNDDLPLALIPASINTYRPLTDIAPFTVRSGMSYQALLEALRVFTTEYFPDYVSGNFESLQAFWQQNFDILQEAIANGFNGQFTDYNNDAHLTLNGTMIAAYGTSWTAGGSWAPGGSYPSRFAALVGATLANRGLGASRLLNTWDSANFPGPIGTGNTLAAAFRGLVILGDPINDIQNASVSGAHADTPSDLSAMRLRNYADTLRALISLAGAFNRIELDGTNTDVVLTGAWADVGPERASNQHIYRTATVGAYVEVSINVGVSGDFAVIGLNRSDMAMGAAEVKLDGAVVGSSTPGIQHEPIYSNGNGLVYVSSPWIVRGRTTPGIHVIRVTKTDATTNPIDIDVIAVGSPNPTPVLVPVPASVGAPYPGDIITASATARSTFLATIQQVVSEYGYASVANLDPTVGLFDTLGFHAPDGIHYTDEGASYLADRLMNATAAVIAKRAASIALLPAGAVTGVPWTNFTLVNGWTNYQTDWVPAQYRLIGDRVQIRGMIAGGALNSNIAALPVGLRPVRKHMVSAVAQGGPGSLSISPAGVLACETGAGAGTWFSFDTEISIS